MKKSYRYRPPFRYLVQGIIILFISLFFLGAVSRNGEFWLKIAMLACFFVTLAVGGSFTIMFFNKINSGHLIIGRDFIEIPGRWNKRTRVMFDDIIAIEERDAHNDEVIHIESIHGYHFIEQDWMTQKSFKTVKRILGRVWGKKQFL